MSEVLPRGVESDHNGDDRCRCLARALDHAVVGDVDMMRRIVSRCRDLHKKSWAPHKFTVAGPRPLTFGEQADGKSACVHGEPRGSAACALCRAGIERTNFAMGEVEDD